METEKLYYQDCHLRQFTAKVLSCQDEESGYQITLDATAFYPEGGGQAWDLGTLGGARVLAVRERDGQIFHLCDRPLAVGQTITGEIDYPRRFDQMQQHTGEHIVSGIIFKKFGYHNVGFHMGSDTVSVDFDGPVSELPQIEWEANEAVWKDLPVRCWYPGREEHVEYRSKRALPWPVRVVEVPGYDRCACCGVHVAHTGEIGLIKLLSCVKFHQGVRIEMVCGARAAALLSQIYVQNRQVSQILSAKPLETGAAAQRIQEALAAEKARAAQLQKELFHQTAQQYAGQDTAVHFTQGLNGRQLRLLAQCIGTVCPLAAVFSGEDGRFDFCLAGAQAPSAGAALAGALNGRGGGRDGFFQGSLRSSRQQIQDFFRTLLRFSPK